MTLLLTVPDSVRLDTPGVCAQVGHMTVPRTRADAAALISHVHRVTAMPDSVSVAALYPVRSKSFAVAERADDFLHSPAASPST